MLLGESRPWDEHHRGIEKVEYIPTDSESIHGTRSENRPRGKVGVSGLTKPIIQWTSIKISYYMLIGPDSPPKGWEANHVQTIPGRGWFPYMRAYGAKAEFFNDQYKFPTITKVKDFSEYIQ